MSIFDKDIVTNDLLYHPKTKTELIVCVEEQLELQGQDANLNIIDVSKITDMSWLFGCFDNKELPICNIDISKWDVSRVTDMHNMFYGCKDFNSDLSKWDVSNVKNMEFVFYYCKNFNCDLSKWDVSNVKNTSQMFGRCNSLTIPNWYYDLYEKGKI